VIKRAILGCFLALVAKTIQAASIDVSAQMATNMGLSIVDTVNPQQAVIGPFGGLNSVDNGSIIGASQAQDMLNVDLSPGGKSVKKRQGFGLDTSFTTSTSPVHGMYKFFDVNGNEVRLVGQDNGLWSSVSGASFIKVSSGTLGATWQCTDWLGQAYCVTSARDTPVRTDGTVAGTSFQGSIPAGTCIASTADRLLVGNTATNPSRIYYSGSTVFTDFTLGVLNTSSSYEDITAPGSQITHLAYHFGYWLWWKDQSFGFMAGTGQTDLQNTVISDTVGTFDNTDVFWQGIDYFRGSDSHIYIYDGATVSPFTRDITPTVQSTNRRKSNSWTQSSQNDFATGAVTSNGPSISLSTAIIPGSVVPSTFQITAYSSSTFLPSGTTSNLNVWPSSITLATNNAGTITDPSFEGTLSTNYSGGGSFLASTAYGGNCTLNPQDGSKFLCLYPGGGVVNLTNPRLYFNVLDNNGISISTKTLSTSEKSCAWTSDTFSDPSLIGKRVKFQFHMIMNNLGTDVHVLTFTNSSYIYGGPISYYYSCEHQTTVGDYWGCSFDNVSLGSSTITSGWYLSGIYDTGFSSSAMSIQSVFTTNTSTPSFAIYSSTASNGIFLPVVTSTTTSAFGNRYIKFSSTISIGGSDQGLTYISSITVIGSSTGTYYSAVDNASNLTSWSNLGVTDSIGNSQITYYTRSSTSSFTVLSTTPVWVSQTKNATVTASTGTYFQLRADFTVTAATEIPTINDFTFNWYEGKASDKMYGTYFDYAIWFAVSLGSSTSSNNRILRYDLLNQAWTLYDIPSNGFLTYNNQLYIGSSSVGKLYKFGNDLTSDDNQPINAYYKTKDFFGASPFLDEDMRTISWYTKASSGTTLTVSYQVNKSTTTSYNINLYSSLGNVMRNNRNFPSGTMVNTINFMFGDNSSNPLWQVFAGGYTYVPRPWNASGP
jgi:hypothetical protein